MAQLILEPNIMLPTCHIKLDKVIRLKMKNMNEEKQKGFLIQTYPFSFYIFRRLRMGNKIVSLTFEKYQVEKS